MSEAGRTNNGAFVASSQLVLEVLTNDSGNYSVQGYVPRMRASFGPIYLGLDESQRYHAEADAINAAIQGLSSAAAFQLAYDAARQVVAPGGGAPTENFSNGDVTTMVLARVAKAWFDLPDERYIKTSGAIGIWNATCPGDFAPVSGAIFMPNPPIGLNGLGAWRGRMLKSAAFQFVQEQRRNLTAQGPLSRAILAQFPANNDLTAATLVGVMMGFLPTTDLNLKHILGTWRRSPNEFAALKAAFNAEVTVDLHQRARDALLGRVVRTMQGKPTPDAVWRTAIKEHQIATSTGLVDVRRGETVEVRIEAATQGDLRHSQGNEIPIFGGDRASGVPPLHACPGYSAAMAVMLGTLTGVMHKP